MALVNTKVVQAFIQAVKETADLVVKADVKAQAYKAKWIAKNPDLTGTNLTQVQVNVVNTFITDLHTLAAGAVVTTVQGKDQPSHGTGALE